MNNQTFEEFYLKYRKISRGYAYGVLHDWSAADDVSQDVLYKMYTIKDGLNIDNEKMMFSLIKRASMNKALDYIKKSSSKHEFVCQEEVAACKLCLNGMPVPLLRNCYSIFNGTKYR